jgi:8-oxo-dGTP pyrophosphatase MutT (NUDIX family)
MEQSYIIFMNNRPIEITAEPEMGKTIRIDGGTAAGEYGSGKELRSALKVALTEVWDAVIPAAHITAANSAEVLDEIKGLFDKVIVAAGGVVVNDEQQILFIFRRGLWDLPKGKMDDGEDSETAAVREIQEETGLQQVNLEHHLMDTYHVYEERGKRILKQTVWYKMHSNDKDLQPQAEEDITEAKWISPRKLDDIYNNTYDNIKLVIEAVIKVLKP